MSNVLRFHRVQRDIPTDAAQLADGETSNTRLSLLALETKAIIDEALDQFSLAEVNLMAAMRAYEAAHGDRALLGQLEWAADIIRRQA
jgi:hypothetical protein